MECAVFILCCFRQVAEGSIDVRRTGVTSAEISWVVSVWWLLCLVDGTQLLIVLVPFSFTNGLDSPGWCGFADSFVLIHVSSNKQGSDYILFTPSWRIVLSLFHLKYNVIANRQANHFYPFFSIPRVHNEGLQEKVKYCL